MISETHHKPFLKWPGGKYRLINRIRAALADGHRLIEPFTGSAAVFLNTRFDRYLLADSNPDLIELYQRLAGEQQPFIDYCNSFFKPANNREARYYRLREEFNSTGDSRKKSALFLYLNRHCYNGLVRYNSKGLFNSPFGRYLKPYFPAREMQHFVQAAQKAEFVHTHFLESMQSAQAGDVIYCDPPYMPLSTTANFTDYHTGGFNWEDHTQLASSARALADRGIPVIISNHDTGRIRKLYREANARIHRFQVRRMISCDAGNRGKVGELIAIFN